MDASHHHRHRPAFLPHTLHSFSSQCLERILYVWAIRHPASGYVQGINDLATPFFEVFLSAYLGKWWFCQQSKVPRHLTNKTIYIYILYTARCRSGRDRSRDPPFARPSRGRGRFVLVPLAFAGWDPGQLHHRATGYPAQRQAHGGAHRAHRRTALRAPRHARRRVYAVCV